jgi:hypothetical protein
MNKRLGRIPKYRLACFFCGRTVDERDVALTQGTALLRVIFGCASR